MKLNTMLKLFVPTGTGLALCCWGRSDLVQLHAARSLWSAIWPAVRFMGKGIVCVTLAQAVSRELFDRLCVVEERDVYFITSTEPSRDFIRSLLRLVR
jgi:hypothetical protein